MRNINASALALFFSLFTCSLLQASGLSPVLDLASLGKDDIVAISPLLPAQDLSLFVGRADASAPIVVSVAGLDIGKLGVGPFQVKYLLAVIKYFFPDTREISLSAIETAVENFNKNYYALPDNIDLSEELAVENRKPDDQYMEDKLAEMQAYAEGKMTVVPFTWSRDPKDTHETVPKFKKRLIELYTSNKAANRPIHIVAHSWGSVLMHEALRQLSVSNPEIKIDNFITIGSPLVPSNMVTAVFMELEISKEGLYANVKKPANVRVWKNFWATRDLGSNAIGVADENVMVDAKAEPLEPELKRIIWKNPFSPAAKTAAQDLLRYLSLPEWHYSYVYDFQAVIKSLNRKVSLPVFKPLVEPRVLSPY